jgi:folate-dependent phosphoribosylglycinamide formyltransferase PurN
MKVDLNKLKWAALFSQTGSEICNLSEKIGTYPNLVISDNVDINNSLDSRIELNCKRILWRKYKGLTKEEKVLYYTRHLIGYDVITLHGWLNIVPAEVCDALSIYNGHPGLINYYPDLKGKDPQVRAWGDIKRYDVLGSVVHKVTPGVDEGPIICYSKKSIIGIDSLDKVFDTLKETSLDSWVDFFNNKRYNIV